MRARSAARAALSSQRGALPDPILSFKALNLPLDSFSLAQEPMTQLQFGISQKFPFPGKLELRQKVAELEAQAVSDDVAESRLALIRDVKLSWWGLFYIDQALKIITKNQSLLRQFVEIAEVKYSVGQGLQQDVLLAQTELSSLLDQEIQFTGARNRERARLNASLGRSADSEILLSGVVIEELPDPYLENQLYAIAEGARPLLARQVKSIQAASTRVELAEKDYYPDFDVGAAYGVRSGSNSFPRTGQRPDLFSLQLSMNLPLFADQKQAQAVDQRTSELLQHQYAHRDGWLRVRSQVSEALSDYLQARKQFSLFASGIIPQARQTVASMLAGYKVNKVDFLNLVRSQITLFNYDIQYWRAFSDAHQSLAKLAAAVGTEKIHE